jgi:uncharacterized protein
MSNWQIERRFTNGEIELRMRGGKTVIQGYAAVFGKRSGNLGGFYEEVGASSFNKTIKEADVRALQNHDPNLVLGRTKSGTLKLSVDSSGLYYEVDAPDTTYARDLMTVMERGDIDQSSFAFRTIKDDWRMEKQGDDEFPIRTLEEVGLVDISPVTYPAYEDATSGVIREMAFANLAKRASCQVGDLCNIDAVRTAILATAGQKPHASTSVEQRKVEMAKRLAELAAIEADPFASLK